MNEIISIIKKYFNCEDISKIKHILEEKQRGNILNDKYFAKVGRNTDKLFFDNLVKEIKLYESNQNNKNMPILVDSYISEEYCLIVLKKINGKTLSNERNNFNTHLSRNKRIKIAKSILNIKNINLKFKLVNDYNRKEKLDKYLERSKKYISKNSYLKIISIYSLLVKDYKKGVISHGDLIPPNIMLDHDEVKFIDWEYISYMPEYYDLTYFLMFSKTNHSLDILDDLKIEKNEVYVDGIILCLKEIQNLAKLYGVVNKFIIDKKIRRWKRELNYILNNY